jgi:hypothetical protein
MLQHVRENARHPWSKVGLVSTFSLMSKGRFLLIAAYLPDGLQESTDPHMCVGYPVPVKAALPRSKDEIIDEKHARYKHTPPIKYGYAPAYA